MKVRIEKGDDIGVTGCSFTVESNSAKMANVFVDTLHCHWKKQTSQPVKSHTKNMP